MRSADGRLATGRWPMLAWLLLGSCTLWLVVQNTILIAVVASAPPEPLISVTGALVKVVGHLLERLWPAAIAFTAVLLLLLVVRRGSQPAPGGGAS